MKLFRKSKSISIILVVCVSFLLLFSQVAFAAGGVKLSASTESGITGEDVTVTINITDALGSEGGQFDLVFDPLILDPKSAARGSFLPNPDNHLFNTNLELDSGKIRVVWVIPEGSALNSGVIGTIVFDLLDDGESTLVFDGLVVAPEGAEVETPTSGEVTSIDPAVAKQAAIDAADAAIAALPSPITLADKAAVEAARALVKTAKDDHGAVDSDFENFKKLTDAEAMILKLEAVKAADDAILALPSVDSLKLDDKPAVVAARALVTKAKTDNGAVDADFTYLARLTAAENRIKELEGLQPTPPTGGMPYGLFAGMAILLSGIVALIRRRRLAVS
jgi:hypothetical protein